MVNDAKNISGKKLLIEEYRKRFRIPENLYYYSEDDLREAERRFIKYNLAHGNSKKPK